MELEHENYQVKLLAGAVIFCFGESRFSHRKSNDAVANFSFNVLMKFRHNIAKKTEWLSYASSSTLKQIRIEQVPASVYFSGSAVDGLRVDKDSMVCQFRHTISLVMI